MRSFISKAVLVAGAALLVTACGDKTETTTENTTVVDMNVTDPMLDGTVTDNMTTSIDAAGGNDTLIANETGNAL